MGGGGMKAVHPGAPWLMCSVEVPRCGVPWVAYFDRNLPCAPLVTYFGAQRREVWRGLLDTNCMSHCDSCEEASLLGSPVWMV